MSFLVTFKSTPGKEDIWGSIEGDEGEWGGEEGHGSGWRTVEGRREGVVGMWRGGGRSVRRSDVPGGN